MQEIFLACWFCIKVNFISLVNPPCEEAYSEPSQTSTMELCAYIDNGARRRVLEWVLNTPLILVKLLSLSTISEEAYSDPSHALRMDVSARIVGLSL